MAEAHLEPMQRLLRLNDPGLRIEPPGRDGLVVALWWLEEHVVGGHSQPDPFFGSGAAERE